MHNLEKFGKNICETRKISSCKKSDSIVMFNWSLSELPTECSEYSEIPTNKKTKSPYFSEFSNQTRVSLLNEVLPKNLKRKLPKVTFSRKSRFTSINANDCNRTGNNKATSLSKVSSLMQSFTDKKKPDESSATIDFETRCKAFDTLHSIAFNFRRNPATISVYQDKYELLRCIHQGQNEMIGSAKTISDSTTSPNLTNSC
jgi:hypothetical protein